MRFWLAAVLCLAPSCGRAAPAPSVSASARRVVILAPSLTEVAFALGRGDRVVGVDAFSRHPPAAARLPRVGGLVDPSLERILSLSPDLVVLTSAAGRFDRRLTAAGVPTRVLRCESLADLRHGVTELGRLLDAHDAAAALVQRVDGELEAVRRATADRPRVRVLYVFDRQPGAIRDVFAAGHRSFLDELLQIAGGANVLAAEDKGAVSVSHEALLASRPDVIFDAARDPAGLAPWSAVPELPAVAAHRLVEASDAIFTIPGPRVGEVARRMARALHPDVRP